MGTILVTGGLGFIGSNFIRYVLNLRKNSLKYNAKIDLKLTKLEIGVKIRVIFFWILN